jgi:hypothetical protein
MTMKHRGRFPKRQRKNSENRLPFNRAHLCYTRRNAGGALLVPEEAALLICLATSQEKGWDTSGLRGVVVFRELISCEANDAVLYPPPRICHYMCLFMD